MKNQFIFPVEFLNPLTPKDREKDYQHPKKKHLPWFRNRIDQLYDKIDTQLHKIDPTINIADAPDLVTTHFLHTYINTLNAKYRNMMRILRQHKMEGVLVSKRFGAKKRLFDTVLLKIFRKSIQKEQVTKRPIIHHLVHSHSKDGKENVLASFTDMQHEKGQHALPFTPTEKYHIYNTYNVFAYHSLVDLMEMYGNILHDFEVKQEGWQR